jgi:hypothetical protein
MIGWMGFLSSVRDAYRGVDRAVTGAERRALEIAVPKKDRKSAKEFAHFLDRFAGMIQSDAPNTDVAPSFVHETLTPFREAKKHPTPWNLYAAAGSAMAVFPWGTKSHAGPREWDSLAVPGGRIVNTETEQSPTYRFIPPGADQPIRNVYNDVTMNDAHSHINMLSHTDRSVPREVLHDFMAPLNNRFQEHGIPIDAMPVNVKVAASVLRSQMKPGEKKYTPYTERQSLGLLQSQLEDLTSVAESMMTDPRRAASYASGIRQQLQTNDASPRAFAKSMKILEGYQRSPEGGDDPRYELPSYARGQGIVDLLKKIQDPDEWEQRTSGISVPRASEHRPADEGPSLTFEPHWYEARSQHTHDEWARMSRAERDDAADRVSSGLPARGDSLDRATEAVMGAIGHPTPARIEPHETLADLGLDTGVNTRPSLTEITRGADVNASTFEEFITRHEEAARHARAGVGEEEWRRMSPEERSSLIRAQMDQNRRSAEHSRAQSHMQALADRADELHRSGIELDITERAVLAASRNPEWNLMSEQERQAEARRERRRIAHESQR